MLQRGLLTFAEKQQQLQQQAQPPYDSLNVTTIREANLFMEQKHSSLKNKNGEEINENFKERIYCLPIIEMPQIKVEQDVEYKGFIEEEQQDKIEQGTVYRAEHLNMELDQGEGKTDDDEERLSIQPVPNLLEPTSILKTSLLTGAANTLATLTAAAEQIARMPNKSLTKSYAFLKEENKRTYALEEETNFAEDIGNNATVANTCTSILQTALMCKRPATLNVASTSTNSSFTSTKPLHVRTPDQILKTAVTLVTLGEIAAQQEQQQLHLQQQQPHILVVPQVPRKMCTLPFKKLNFANVTTTKTSSESNNAASTTCASTSITKSVSGTDTAKTNNYLGSNLKTNTNFIINRSILNTNNLAATTRNKREKLDSTTTPTTFFDTNNIINTVAICSKNNNSNINNNTIFKSQTMGTQTLKIPTLKPQLVTTQTQTEETSTKIPALQQQSPTSSIPLSLTTTLTNSKASSLQTASSGSSSGSGLLRTAVSTNTKLLAQTPSPLTNTTSMPLSPTFSSLLTNKFPIKTNLEANENVAATTNVANNIIGNIYKHVSDNATSPLTKINVIQQNKCAVSNTNIGPAIVAPSDDASNSRNSATNVTVVVFETMLPED